MINTYDLETYKENEKVIPYCVCFILEEKNYSIYFSESYNLIIKSLDIIVKNSSKNDIEIFVHNLNFDGIIIIENISEKNIKYQIMSKKTNIYFIEIEYLNKKIKFRCSYKIIPMSLKKIGSIENFNKTLFPYKFVNKKNLFYKGPIPSKEFWENNEYETYMKKHKENYFNLQKKTEDYCLNDAILTKKFLENIITIVQLEGKNLIKKSFSSASLSHKIFYKNYNLNKIPEKIYKKDEEFIRNSYFGGRCEVFGNIKEDEHVKYFDFSGMYAQCMLENFHNGKGDYALEKDFTKPGFYTIEYISKFNFLPILPTHSETGKLLFLNKKGIGTYWFEEIKLFLDRGGIVNKIINSYTYEKFEKVFFNFVETFTKIKEKGGYYKIFGKLIINSLYGSMAFKNEEEMMFLTYSEAEFYFLLENLTIINFYNINKTYVIIVKEDYKAEKYLKIKRTNLSTRNISYSSAISSKARIKLYTAMEEVINDGGRLLYCDTDSIFAAYKKHDLREKTKILNWLDFYDDAVFIAPKTYALKNKEKEEIKIKGVNVNEKTFNEIKSLFYEEKNITFENQLIFSRMNFNLNQHFKNKNISLNNYDKRIFIDNKKNTIPIWI